jgi:hypothetical protein
VPPNCLGTVGKRPSNPIPVTPPNPLPLLGGQTQLANMDAHAYLTLFTDFHDSTRQEQPGDVALLR